jgi:hypothetical protein
MNPQEQGPEGTGSVPEEGAKGFPVQASKGAVPEGFFFAQQTLGATAKNPDGTNRCHAEGRSPGTTRAGAGPAGGLAKEIERS